VPANHVITVKEGTGIIQNAPLVRAARVTSF